MQHSGLVSAGFGNFIHPEKAVLQNYGDAQIWANLKVTPFIDVWSPLLSGLRPSGVSATHVQLAPALFTPVGPACLALAAPWCLLLMTKIPVAAVRRRVSFCTPWPIASL